MGNVVKAVFGKNAKEIQTAPLFQYDYGQILIIEGITLPTAYQVHFSNEPYGTSTTSIGGADGVEIPDAYLQSGADVYAWLFLQTGENDGRTVAMIRIPVKARAEITNEEPTEGQQGEIDQLIAALNDAVEDAEDSAEDAEDAAEDAADSAEDAEAWAQGTRGGEPVGSTDPAYQKNSKYYSEQAAQYDPDGKIDKVTTATSGNFASFNSEGGLQDSGHKHSDYLTAHQDISGKANLTVIAPAFAQATANDAGSFVTYTDGKVYFLENGHTAGTSWENTTKAETNIGAQVGALKNALQVQKEDTDDSFANLISVVEGYDVFKATLTEGYFASYNTKVIAALSECNVATLDVTRVVKFKYNYTINIPDSRGLFFEDKNGNKLDSYQTLTTEQDITVPEGAVKCYATVLNTEDVVAYEIVGDKPVEILKNQATYTDKDNSGGIKYQWSEDHKTITISGTRTGNSFDGMAGGTSTIPTGMIPGKKYQLVFNPVSDKILFGVIVNKDGSQISQKFVNKPTIYKIPEDATGVMVRIIVNGTNAVVNETVNCPEIYTVPETKSIAEQINDLNDAAYGSDTDPLAYIRRDAGLLSVFHKVGCIGDSLASGASAYKVGGVTNYTDNYDFSWGQCLARLTGNTYYNFSAGGLSTRSWLASQKATDCFDGNHTCDAYFIGLGQNDKNNSIPVGTTADINLSDYTQNADTYCGNMGKIIQKVQELQPKAPIFVFIDPLPPSGDQAYNNVIDDIVELFDNVWIIDLLTYSKGMFSNSFDVIGSQYRSGHYSAVGYQEIAYVIATYTDWIIRHNLSDFSQVEFIGTNYEWTD